MRPNYNEIAGIDNGRDVTRGWVDDYWGYLPTQDPILSLKSGGDLNLYEKVLEDYQVKSCLQQRFSKLTRKKAEALPGGTKAIDQKAADAMLAQLKKLPWDAITKKMLMGVFYGYSLGEIIWQPNGGAVDIAAIKVRNRRRFKFGVDYQPRLLTHKDPLGEPLPERKFWYFCTGADNDDEPDGRGLGYWLYWLTWFKRNDIRWWITFLENFAEPSRVGKYPAGATDAEKRTLENAVQMLGRHKWATMPEGMLYELIEASRSGTADYQAMVQTLDSAISKIIVGQTMTTDNGSSRSQAEVHEGVGDAVTAEDNDLISDSLQDLSRWWTEWNYPGAQPPIITRKMSEMDMGAEADKDTKLLALGISLKPEAIVAKYGDDYLIPDNKEQTPQLNSEQVNALVSIVTSAKQGGWSPELVAGMINGAFPSWPDEAVAAITDNIGSADDGEGGQSVPAGEDTEDRTIDEDADAKFAAPDRDIVDDYVAQMAARYPFKPWLQQAKSLLLESSSLEDYSTKLENFYPDIPSEDFNNLMVDAMSAASMAGYFDAESEVADDAEFARIPEGATRRRAGVDYILKDSRWHRSEVQSPEVKKPSYERTEEIYSLVDALESGVKSGDADAGEGFLRGLKQLNSRDDAERWAAKIDMSGLGGGKMRSQALKDAADFYQLIGKDLGIQTIRSEATRSYANPVDRSIGLEPDTPKKQRSTLFHEMGHFSEFNDPDSLLLARGLLKKRGTGEPEALSKLTGVAAYRADEYAVPDRFVDPYVGKQYPNATEVHSMGLEAFSDGRKVVDLFQKDREHFDLIIRYIRVSS